MDKLLILRHRRNNQESLCKFEGDSGQFLKFGTTDVFFSEEEVLEDYEIVAEMPMERAIYKLSPVMAV